MGALLAVVTLVAGCATPASRGIPVSAAGGVLVERQSGMTLYTFDRDVAGSGRSMCSGPCAANWPPLLAADGARDFKEYAVIDREDGTRQWTWKGRPLYRWSRDRVPGDRSGDGVGNLWRLARP